VDREHGNERAWMSTPGIRNFGLIGLLGTFTTIMPLMMSYEHLYISLSIIFMIIISDNN